MFRKLTAYLSPLMLAALLTGCSQDEPMPGPGAASDGQMVITLRNAPSTRSADNHNNEDLIENLVIALYSEVADETTPAVMLQKFTDINAHESHTATLSINKNNVTALFGDRDGAQCRVFAVANVNLDEVKETSSIDELQALSASSEFKTAKQQKSFVMASGVTDKVTYSAGGTVGSASGSVSLNRAAAKISLNISLPESATDSNDPVWVPVTHSDGSIDARVLLNNGVWQSIAVPLTGEELVNAPDSYYSILTSDADVVRGMTKGSSADYLYTIDVPFYSYPNRWNESPEESRKTTMTLMVPWNRQGTSEYATYYYEVPVTDLEFLASNYAYTVNLKVNMLGSLTPDNPLELTDLTYQIVNWSNQNVDVNLNNYRYLVVSPNSYVVDNRTTVDIPFYTSHDVEISDISIQYNLLNYYSNGNGTVVPVTISKSQIDNTNAKNTSGTVFCSYSTATDVANNRVLSVTHTLESWTPYRSNGSDIKTTGQTGDTELNYLRDDGTYYSRPDSPETSYVPFTITVTLRHKDNPDFSETVTITQYPPIYIEAVPNPGGGPGDNGYVYVNSHDTYSNDKYSTLGGVHGLTGDGNKNPNMYLINISVLDVNSKYIIGDPRIKGYDNTLDSSDDITTGSFNAAEASGPPTRYTQNTNWCYPGKSIYDDTTRKLKYYQPTNEGSTTANMIAPKIRVASSYGVTNAVTRTNARRRIATYQERNRPAGRWRLPTAAELEYICSLSSTGKIPVLFTTGSSYWTAQGSYLVNSDGTVTPSKSRSCYVRGVYDEWYWEQFPAYQLLPNSNGGYGYTLGDMPYQGN